MKKRLISFLLVLVLVISVCPVALAEGTDITIQEVDLGGGLGTAKVSGLRQVYGYTADDEDYPLSDDDAMVLLIMGDGFQAGELEKFYEEATNTANYIMQCSPYDEFYDTIKIYALGVASTDTGVRGQSAGSQAEAKAEEIDTFFGASFYATDMQRLMELSSLGEARGKALQERYLPKADFCLYIVNSTTYGGSGGEYCIASLNTQSYDMMLHEMGHTIANLADEYYAADYAGEYPNLTENSDPNTVKWSQFIGKNDIGVYPWDGVDGRGYYMPALDCKMRYLSYTYEEDGETKVYTYDFCEVCKEAIRKAICKYSNVPKLFFQPYANDILPGEDLSQYFILRQGSSEETNVDNLSAFYGYYEDGSWVDLGYVVPTEPGTYWVGAGIYDYDMGGWSLLSDWYEYTLEAADYQISLRASSKVYDGEPADVTYSVTVLNDAYETLYENGTHFVSVDYYVTPYSTSGTTYYYGDRCDDSGLYDVWSSADGYNEIVEEGVGAPSAAGEYEVSVSVMSYDWESGAYIYYAYKSAKYTIALASTSIVDNNDSNYYGAYSYGNNKTVMIYGEGFTAEEQDKFDALAKKLTNSLLAKEPFKELQLYFNFMSVNTVSNDSGVSTADTAKDTFFGLRYDPETGKIVTEYDPCSSATSLATKMCYSYASTNESAACVIIVNDKNVTGSSTYAPYVDSPTYHYFQTIFVSPSDTEWTDYAAAEILNYLTKSGVGYRAVTKEQKEAQRLGVIESMSCAYQNGFGPVIASRAYNEVFVFNGKPVDLEPYFHVYNGGEEIFGVKLELTYYADDNGKPGEKLTGAPFLPGTYHVKAETVPDPEYADDPYSWGWQLYQPTSEDEELWIGLSRGWTTFTIKWSNGSSGSSGSGGASGSTAGNEEAPSTGFVDVPVGAYYYDAVQWAVDNGVTTGATARTFAPEKSCTRAEAVTFLWRAMGEPEPKSSENPFTDVSESAYYYKAVLWAVEQGITTGAGDTTFSPNDPCSRAQIVTFLWRLDGDKEVDAANPFTDVADSAYYADAVQWAVEEGVTTGTTTATFSPAAACTRAQIVTFLYRYIAE